ncbi:MAG: hypothetical protein PHE84_01500 [bacterium]|nr:hypothetical protein [bacterium]
MLRRKLIWMFILIVIVGCDLAYPEVAVVNKTNKYILLKNVSFKGCIWNTVLAYGEATSPQQCLPGEDKVHFQKFDAEEYCQEQVKDGTINGLCQCEGSEGITAPVIDAGLINVNPTWFNYQTISIKHVGYGDFKVYEITLDDIEQDFSTPGPYGH